MFRIPSNHIRDTNLSELQRPVCSGRVSNPNGNIRPLGVAKRKGHRSRCGNGIVTEVGLHVERACQKLLIERCREVKMLNMYGGKSHKTDVPKNPGNAVLRILTLAGRIVGPVDYNYDQIRALTRSHLRSDLAIPRGESSLMLANVMAVNPNTCITVDTIETNEDGFSGEV